MATRILVGRARFGAEGENQARLQRNISSAAHAANPDVRPLRRCVDPVEEIMKIVDRVLADQACPALPDAWADMS